ncbi:MULTISPECIES: hypothetical protein [Streptomyces]|uniref:Uncharacterized protein n=1 Tax=Streptomyces venezuelae TaxID=54571 RepID=A0A5P2B3F8_STRVZ|nr:hypothetical protein [Streptomyces venezuelae]QES24278.1 hypothetical protein DEJ46_38615 [Streptomyces venezuelae]
MTEKKPGSESPELRIMDASDVTGDSGGKPPAQGVVSVVYADGLGNPPTLLLTGASGYPESLLLVDGTGTPVATYTAGPAPLTRGVDLNEVAHTLK